MKKETGRPCLWGARSVKKKKKRIKKEKKRKRELVSIMDNNDQVGIDSVGVTINTSILITVTFLQPHQRLEEATIETVNSILTIYDS